MLTTEDVKLLTDLFATKQELKDSEERVISELRKDIRKYAADVEKVLSGDSKKEEDDLVHRQEHDDLDERVTRIESTPTVALELNSQT